MNQVTYVSSEQDIVKKSQLNNVIQSLNCFVSCTAPDKTEQEYGILSYTGTIKKGQVLCGSKRPRKAGTPVIAGGAWLGNIDRNGRLTITNTCSSTSTISVTEGYCCIQYNAIQDCTSPGSSCYWCDATYLEGSCITCTPGEDEQGSYVCVTSCCTWVTPVHEKCVFACAFRNVPSFETSGAVLCKYLLGSYYRYYESIGLVSVNSLETWQYTVPLASLTTCPPTHSDNCSHCYTYGSYYPVGGSTGYRFDGENLCYDLAYCIDSKEVLWHVIGDCCWLMDSTERNNVGCYTGSVGPFLCGFDVTTGKMKWNLNPSTFSMSINPTSNMGYCSYLCVTTMDYKYCYCTHLSNTSACSTSKVDKALIVCANSCKYCTLCVATKLRPIDCVSIHERYY